MTKIYGMEPKICNILVDSFNALSTKTKWTFCRMKTVKKSALQLSVKNHKQKTIKTTEKLQKNMFKT